MAPEVAGGKQCGACFAVVLEVVAFAEGTTCGLELRPWFAGRRCAASCGVDWRVVGGLGLWIHMLSGVFLVVALFTQCLMLSAGGTVVLAVQFTAVVTPGGSCCDAAKADISWTGTLEVGPCAESAARFGVVDFGAVFAFARE